TSIPTFSISCPGVKPFRRRVAHNPYSRVLEGHHLSIRPTPRAGRARKSPPIVKPIGEVIRNATRPVFHKGNSLIKEKRTKKEKQNSLWKMPQPWKSAKQSGGLRRLLLDTDSHGCLEKPRKSTEAFPHLPQARLRSIHGRKTSS